MAGEDGLKKSTFDLMNNQSPELTPVPCRCGKAPEVNTMLTEPYTHSLLCRCDGPKVNFLARGFSYESNVGNWKALIEELSLPVGVCRTETAEEVPQPAWYPPDDSANNEDSLPRCGPC